MNGRDYDDWILANVPDMAAAYGRCAGVTLAMAAAFQELRRVRGHYYDVAWGQRDHWWLVDATGNVIDPTAIQFPSGGTCTYVEFTGDDKELPTGKCISCGGPVFRGAGSGDVCSEQCYAEFRAELYSNARTP